MRALVVAVVVVGCADAPRSTGVPYLDDRTHRRSELEHVLVDPSNGYSQLRLQNYALANGGWDALAEWNPAVATVAADGSTALGEQAFFAYPVQPVPIGIASAGVWSDPARGRGGLVELADGRRYGSCATCHSSVRAGVLVPGLANEQLDLGEALVQGGEVAATDVAAYLAWGPGRLDVTTIAGTEPVRIPDLRAVRLLTFLQADADVAQVDLDALAIRLETLMITSTGETARPPRIVALAIARYLWSLADGFAPAEASLDGAAVFAASCASCHVPPAFTGAPVPLDVIGTDPTLGDSLVRGTGAYRVPSLRGVGLRALLLHDGSLPSLDAMVDPARLDASYTGGVRPGAVPGHVFGLDLSDSDRSSLLAYVEAL